MAQTIINISTPNDGQGDPLRNAFQQVNTMFTELYGQAVFKEAGKGLSSNDLTSLLLTKLNEIEAGAEVNVQSDLAQEDSSKDDYVKGQEVFYNSKPIKIKHTPAVRMGLNIQTDTRESDFMEVNGFWYCWDYFNSWKFIPKFYPKFSNQENDSLIEILHIKQLSAQPYFPYPDYFSGLKSAKIEAALIDDAVNHVLRGFQGKTIINVNNGGMMSDDEKEEIRKKIAKDWTGTENSDGVTISVNDSAEEAIIVDTIEPRGRNEQFVTYDETAEIKLMAAHSAMNILFQRPGSSGFSNNADEIATATDSLYLGVINPMREILIDYLSQVFKKINPACDIDFVNFGQEKLIKNE